MSLRRKLSALEKLTRGRESASCGLEPNCHDPQDVEKLYHYDRATDVLTELPEGTQRGHRIFLDWQKTRVFLMAPGQVLPPLPTIRRLDGTVEGNGGE